MKIKNPISANAACKSSVCIPAYIVMALSGFISAKYLGAFYSIFSGLILLILMLFWQKSLSIQVEFEGVFYRLFRALFFISVTGFFFTVRYLQHFDALGINEIFSHLKGETVKDNLLTVQGSYRWVRHPLYFFRLLMIWSQVSVTTDRLLFNGRWTFWIIIGAFLEEGVLITSFGVAYRNYQRKVPMLIPLQVVLAAAQSTVTHAPRAA